MNVLCCRVIMARVQFSKDCCPFVKILEELGLDSRPAKNDLSQQIKICFCLILFTKIKSSPTLITFCIRFDHCDDKKIY